MAGQVSCAWSAKRFGPGRQGSVESGLRWRFVLRSTPLLDRQLITPRLVALPPKLNSEISAT
jgi:hypothetical protein